MVLQGCVQLRNRFKKFFLRRCGTGQVGGGNNGVNPVVNGYPGHGDRSFRIQSAVIYTGKDMTMDIDHEDSGGDRMNATAYSLCSVFLFYCNNHSNHNILNRFDFYADR